MITGVLMAVLVSVPNRPQVLEWLPVSRPVAEFTLASAEGVFTQAQLRGGWHLVLFGYSHCPDNCPTSLAELSLLRNALQDLPLQVVFVSVDARDNPATLARYVRYFHPDFMGITGDRLNLTALADSMGVRFEVSEPGSPLVIAHSIVLSLVDPEGQLRGRLRPGFDVDGAAREIIQKLSARS